jgi:hypothetical protein
MVDAAWTTRRPEREDSTMRINRRGFGAALATTAAAAAVPAALADPPAKPEPMRPSPIELPHVDAGDGWTKWEGLADIRGMMGARERLTALALGVGETVWVGTSHGRVLSRDGGRWTLQANIDPTPVTGIAVAPKAVWLSTGDGVCRLDPADGGGWSLATFREYYEGHPSFVSGGYIPGEDAVRLWGRVDSIYFPPRDATYAPFAVSTEHGLFAWGGYGRVWHHFLPHYWGANSAWLDLRELIPHRRPTAIVEDAEGALWVGTEGDGFLRFNAPARAYHKRDSPEARKDGREFSHVSGDDVGAPFDRVASIAAGRGSGIWAVLRRPTKRFTLARFVDGRWATLDLPDDLKDAAGVAEVAPGRVFVGVEFRRRPAGLLAVDWEARTSKPVDPIQYSVHSLAVTPGGRLFAASWWGLYETKP